MAQDYVKGLLSTGEVVLIDTRQHWMALVRFALKPILLLLLVGGLILLNQWLNFDGILGILNDLIHIILVVSIIAAVIWLPIDVVRWMSRHFVLTNRRSMRMDGVLRKKSFDSSLEQINDISFTESVFGRAMGYADLTLLTASDTANETYEQLMDGLQYKKAVLDAKEAIRLGSPLQELIPGFIVKGGTNLASMRADGKLEEAAAADSAAAAAAPEATADAPIEPVTAEVLAQRSDPGSTIASPAPPPPPADVSDGAASADAQDQADHEASQDEPTTAQTPSSETAWPKADQVAPDANTDESPVAGEADTPKTGGSTDS